MYSLLRGCEVEVYVRQQYLIMLTVLIISYFFQAAMATYATWLPPTHSRYSYMKTSLWSGPLRWLWHRFRLKSVPSSEYLLNVVKTIKDVSW